jgi:hypothetical protein
LAGSRVFLNSGFGQPGKVVEAPLLHQDYVVKKGTDTAALKTAMLKLLDARGAEYPAEHNVGHIYAAKPDLAAHYTALDPTNSFNPGIGKTSRSRVAFQFNGCTCGEPNQQSTRISVPK